MNNNKVFSKIFKCLSISIIFTLIGLIVGNIFIPPSVVYMANIIASVLMVIVVIMALFSRKGLIPRRFSMNYVYLFTFFEGVLMYPLINYYLSDLGMNAVISIFVATIILFAGLSMYGRNKNINNILSFGKMLFYILVAVVVCTIINVFLNSSTTSIVLSAIGVFLFSTYIIYDINMIKRDIENSVIKDTKDLSIHVFNLYIDFINLVLDLLNIASRIDD